MSFENRGYLTAAYRNYIYAEQAVCLVLSFKHKGDHTPFSIVVDDANYDYLKRNNYIPFFDRVMVLPSNQLYEFIGKLYSALQTPYQDTIYFDSDCLLIRCSDKLNHALSAHNFCVPGADMTSGIYYGINMEDWLQLNQLKYIPIFNAGVFRFNDEGKKIVAQALQIMQTPEKYKLPKADGGLNEQVALGIAMSLNNIHPIVYDEDYHFSFFNANTPLKLNIIEGICEYRKETINRAPYIFHYTPLYHAGLYFSKSRYILMQEINRLRTIYKLTPIEFFKPNFRDLFALLRQGKIWSDKR